MGAQPPVSAPTAGAPTAGGSVPNGAHTYKVTFLYYDFEESNGSPASGVQTAGAGNNTIPLSSIPIGGYGVTARKIYRDDNDGNYRLVGEVSNNTATIFSDTALTGTAEIPTDNSLPPNFSQITLHLDRLWVSKPGDSTIFHSEAGQPDIFRSTNFILCNPRDPILGHVVYADRIIVLNRNSLGQILGRTSDTFRYSEIPSSVGCVDNRSIQIRTIQGIPVLVWLSDKGLYQYNGSSIDYISDPVEDQVNFNIQQASQVKGRNSQDTQASFQGGTSSPGIDLTSSPGFITTPNPRRIWDDEGDWEGGSSLTNVATNNTNSQIRVPLRYEPSVAQGSLNNLILSGGNALRTPVVADFTGASRVGVFQHANENHSSLAYSIVPERTGTISSLTLRLSGTFNSGMTIWSDSFGIPGAVLFTGAVFVPSGDGYVTLSPNIVLTKNVRYWVGFNSTTIHTLINVTPLQGGAFETTTKIFTSSWITPVLQPSQSVGTSSENYVLTATLIPTSGIWIGLTHDSLSDGAVAATVALTGTYPASTSSITTVEGAVNSSFTSGLVSQTFANLSGSSAVTLAARRYWRIKIQLYTADDRVTATVSGPVLKFSTTATWISEAIDHTTDITVLNSLSAVSSSPAGTTVTVEIATSANNIVYTAFGPLGSATVQRYSKIRATLTTNVDDTVTPTVNSITLTWTLVSNLVSSAIDTGSVPAGWDIFQSSFQLNGGTVVFAIRSAATAVGLTAEAFVAVTNGSFPAITSFRFVQWRVTITSTSNSAPAIDSVTVNWFISQVESIRVASLFFNRSYYLAAAEFDNSTNNVVFKLDDDNNWRVYRGLSIATLSFFFNDPFFGSSTEGVVARFLEGASDLGANIVLDVRTKAFNFGKDDKTKILRKVYVTGKNTGASYQFFFSVNEGADWIALADPETGDTTIVTTSDDLRFVKRLQPIFVEGTQTQGRTIIFRALNQDDKDVELRVVRIEAWVRTGELLGV